MKKINFILINIDFNIFINFIIDIIITLYINNIFIINFFKINIQRVKNALYIKFKINDLDFYVYYLNMIIFYNRINQILRLKQFVYIE